MSARGPISSAVLHRKIATVIDRIAAAHPQKLEWLPYPEGLCKEAFNDIDDKCCVVRQMVEALDGYELAEVRDQVDDIEQIVYDKSASPFRDMGVTPRMVLEWCKEGNVPCTILHGPKACEAYAAQGGKPLVMCFWESRCYAWKGHAATNMARRGKHLDGSSSKVAKQRVKGAAPFEQRRPWKGSVTPRHFYVSELSQTTWRQCESLGIRFRDEKSPC